MRVLIADYGMGNLASVHKALKKCGADGLTSDNPKDLAHCTHVILPGVGAFAQGMLNLEQSGWAISLQTVVAQKKIFLLGICLGMQVLADVGVEGGRARGLGLIGGEVKRLTEQTPEERIPHVGWNEVHQGRKHLLFSEIPEAADFYFVHSYHFVPADPVSVIGSTPYCGGFAAAIGKDRVMGVQFHPEKSHYAGLRLLKNFLALN